MQPDRDKSTLESHEQGQAAPRPPQGSRSSSTRRVIARRGLAGLRQAPTPREWKDEPIAGSTGTPGASREARAPRETQSAKPRRMGRGLPPRAVSGASRERQRKGRARQPGFQAAVAPGEGPLAGTRAMRPTCAARRRRILLQVLQLLRPNAGGGASSPGARGRGHRVASNRAAAGRAGCERRGPRDERPFQSRSREPRTRAERRPARRSGTGGSARVHREKGPRGRPASPAIATSAPAYLELAGSRWAPGRGVAGLPGTGLS